MMGKIPVELAQKDSYYKELDTNSCRGNVNNTIIRTEKGKTTMLQYDITSPRVYLRIHKLRNKKSAAQKYQTPEWISLGYEWLDDEEMKKILEK